MAIAKPFFASRFFRIAEGSGDLSVRARRARAAIHAIELRGDKCKKIPFDTEFPRWAHDELDVTNAHTRSPDVVFSRVGLLGAFFAWLRISEMLQLSLRVTLNMRTNRQEWYIQF